MGRFERGRDVVLCFLAGVTSLMGIFHVEGRALGERPAPPLLAEEVVGSALAFGHASSRLAAEHPPVYVALPSTQVEDGPVETVRMPGLVGLRLKTALQRAADRNVQLIVKDEYGEAVDPARMRFYRVVEQDVRRGRAVPVTESVEIWVRDRTASYGDWG